MDVLLHSLSHMSGCHGEWQILIPWFSENLPWLQSQVSRVVSRG